MTISYNWICKYLPLPIDGIPLPDQDKMAQILTSVGLEVESLTPYESIKGGLKGVVVGEVLSCEKHPNADKLKLTTVNIGAEKNLQIVCGAANVAAGQKVLVATIGATIYPIDGEPLTMKAAKIRGELSEGMICAEDELGLGNSHDGILVLPDNVEIGTPAASYFDIYTDYIFEIGLTPNRMDAMSHFGVARDICAYLSHHYKREVLPVSPYKNGFKPDDTKSTFKVELENQEACQRYAGIVLDDVKVAPSPAWLKNALEAIGVRSINNVVDITNYILHESGQPLHAFDANCIEAKTIKVKNLPNGTVFISLDEKERKLFAEDLMICDGNDHPLCIGGVFGGLKSGVTEKTTSIFLESAWFHPTSIRKSSLKHQLRTDAATRFEKGVDISKTVEVLKRAALLIKEIGGAKIVSDVIDVYPKPHEKTEVALKYHYLKRLSGKNYHPDTVKRILQTLGFEIVKEGMDEIRWAVPHFKPDVQLPADLVEEIIRIDGLDNVEIPTAITITPAVNRLHIKENLKEKIAAQLIGRGFREILTNSITNSKYYDASVLEHSVKLLNNLSADLDVLKPSMLETGLEAIAYNLNRKNQHIRFFEIGKVYARKGENAYQESEQVALYLCGKSTIDGWKQNSVEVDFFELKGQVDALLQSVGIKEIVYEKHPTKLQLTLLYKGKNIGSIEQVNPIKLQQFDIKQTVYYAVLHFAELYAAVQKHQISYKEVSKFPPVERDLAIIVTKSIRYQEIETTIAKLKINKLQSLRLFDVFEHEKIGSDNKSLAMNFVFVDDEKTLTDKEIDAMMSKITKALETTFNATLRK